LPELGYNKLMSLKHDVKDGLVKTFFFTRTPAMERIGLPGLIAIPIEEIDEASRSDAHSEKTGDAGASAGESGEDAGT
jgi:hypothetical protein